MGLFTKFRIREFLFFFGSAIIIIIVARFLNVLFAKFAKIKTSRILPDPEYCRIVFYTFHPLILDAEANSSNY